MRVKKLLVIALIAFPMMGMAQSSYEQDQREVDKRGYPKKKTVKAKMELVSLYIDLLIQERDSPELNQNLDVDKVNSKIGMWQNQFDDLAALLKKI